MKTLWDKSQSASYKSPYTDLPKNLIKILLEKIRKE